MILKNRQMYSSHENTLFDVISGYVSSNPELSVYKIYPKDLKKMMPYANEGYIYKLLYESIETMSEKPLLFEIKMPNGTTKKVKMPWYQVLTYEDCDTSGKFSHITFQPTPFFKMLLVSASIIHGAYYKISVSAKITSKYSRNLYYILESRKKYRNYYSSDTGAFKIPIKDFQKLIDYPANFKTYDIKRRILEVAKKDINNLEDCDFTFDYKFKKEKTEIDKRKSYSHIEFTIALKDIVKSDIIDNIEEKSEDEVLYTLLKQVDITDDERWLIIRKYHENNRDIDYLMIACKCQAKFYIVR